MYIRQKITSSRGKNLAEPLRPLAEILIVKPPGSLRVAGPVASDTPLPVILLLCLLLALLLGLRVGQGVDEAGGGSRLELKLPVLAADDPRDEELLAGGGDEVAAGGSGSGRESGRRLWLGRGERYVES